MIFKCPYAERRPGQPLLFCKKRDKTCVNQRFCTTRRETVLTQFSKDCPARKEGNFVPSDAPKKKQKQKNAEKKAKPKKETDAE